MEFFQHIWYKARGQIWDMKLTFPEATLEGAIRKFVVFTICNTSKKQVESNKSEFTVTHPLER